MGVVLVALGVTEGGEKILWLVQTVAENQTVYATFLRELVARGVHADAGLFVVRLRHASAA